MPDPVRVFVSHHHSSEEDAVTARLVADLKRAGADVWVDAENLTSGDFVRKISEGLDGRQWLVLVMTPAALASPWVKQEVDAALGEYTYGRMLGVIPFQILPCDVGDIPMLWRNLQRCDATQGYESARDQLFEVLRLPPLHVSTSSHPLETRVPRRSSGGARILAIANDEGKVGKTTTVVNLAACLAESGRRVLVVDIDPKSRATLSFGVDSHKIGNSIYEPLVKENVTADQVIKREIIPNLSLLPSKVDLYAADIELIYLDQRETRLLRTLDDIRQNYDFILIDCPPSLGLLTVNALTAADGVIIPLECDYFALEGMQQLLNTIRLVRDRLNPQIMVFGVVLTKYNPREYLATEIVRELAEYFPEEKFNTIIPLNVRLKEAPSYGLTILQHDAHSPGALAYKQLAEEVIARAAALEN